jgi:magnesium transporter
MTRQTEILHRKVPDDADDAHRPPPGAVPGTLIEVEDAQPTRITIVDYGPEHHEVRELTDPTEIRPYIDKASVTWIDVTGFKDVAAIRTLGEMLDIHPLALADAVNIPQRAKAEAYPDYVFIVTHAPEVTGEGFYSEQVSVLFSGHFVLSFQERSNEDLYKPLRDRIKSARGLVRNKGTAYLGYAIVDVITDTYFPVLDSLEDKLDALEKRILGGELNVLQDLYALRHTALDIRRAIESHRDALSTLMHMQVASIPDEVRLYMRDCLDHALSQVSTAQSMLDYAVSLRELLASEQAQSLNQVIKVLTIVSSIFIPLSFFAGVYGMNFEGRGNMPELSTPYFYWIWWLLMAGVATGMLVFFRRKGWIGRGK